MSTENFWEGERRNKKHSKADPQAPQKKPAKGANLDFLERDKERPIPAGQTSSGAGLGGFCKNGFQRFGEQGQTSWRNSLPQEMQDMSIKNSSR